VDDIDSLIAWDDQLRVLLQPRAGIGAGPGTSEVAADSVELHVTYEFPD
jgi:hypothetical protein